MTTADLEQRMDATLNHLRQEFQGLRTGRASVDLLSPIMVEMYGQKMPINQVGTINAPEARMLTVQVWDKSAVGAVEKAIREAGMGLNPSSDGQLIRVPLPELNEERRKELVKLASKYAEDARVSVRNIRRDGMDTIKKQEKNKEISEDEAHAASEEVQKLTDKFIDQVDDLLKHKEADILKV